MVLKFVWPMQLFDYYFTLVELHNHRYLKSYCIFIIDIFTNSKFYFVYCTINRLIINN